MNSGFKLTPLGEVPEDWDVCHVDEFLTDKKGAMKIGPFGSQLKKDSMVPSGIKVYGQENIFVNDMSYGDRFITTDHYERLKTCELFPGDFIISMMGTIGKCMVVPQGIQKGIMDSHLLRLQLNEEKMSTNFLSQLFSSPLVLDQVKKLAVGGIMDGLSSAIVKKIFFVCPPPGEQQKIAGILSTVDEKIEVIEEQINQTTELKKGLMQRLLTKGIGHTQFKASLLGEIPESWEVKTLGECSSLMTNGFVGTATSHYTDASDGITYIQGYNVQENKFRLNGIKKVTPEFHYKQSKSILKSGDVLTVQTGHIGTSVVVTKEYEGLNCHALIITRPLPNILDSYFLCQFINSSIGKSQCKKIEVGTTMKHINVSHFLKFQIVVPPLSEQQKIAKILTTIDERLEVLQLKKLHYSQLKQGLMQQLLTGKIRVNQTNSNTDATRSQHLQATLASV